MADIHSWGALDKCWLGMLLQKIKVNLTFGVTMVGGPILINSDSVYGAISVVAI